MYRTVKVASLLAIAVLSSPLRAGDAQSARRGDAGAAADTAPQSVLPGPAAAGGRPVSNRLRFRNGPVCMCGDGLREQDIRRAEAESSNDNNRVEKQ